MIESTETIAVIIILGMIGSILTALVRKS